MPENGNTPEIHIHPLSQRNGHPHRTFTVDGALGRIVKGRIGDSNLLTIVEFLGPDGDVVAERIPVDKSIYLSRKTSRACIDHALEERAGTS